MGSIALQADTVDSPETEPTAAHPSILAAARRVAERDGISSLSLLSVAQEAGVPPVAVYACFNSKNDLLLSVIANDLGTLARAMRGVFETDKDTVSSAQQLISSVPVRMALPAAAIASVREPAVANIANEQSEPPARGPDDNESSTQNSASHATDSGVAELLAKLQETVTRLETRPVDAWLERRLREFERALSTLEGRQSERNNTTKTAEERIRELNEGIESLEHRLLAAAEDSARSLVQRIDACENHLRGVASDTHADAATLATRITALENAAFAVKPEFFSTAPGSTSETDKAADRIVAEPAPEAASAEPIVAAAAPTSSYLAAARKSAQAAAAVQDTHVRKTTKHKSQTMVYVAMGSLFLFAALLMASGLLLHSLGTDTSSAQARVQSPPVESHAAALAGSKAYMNPQQRLRVLAEAGDPKAELLIGAEYLDGSGVARNDAVAFAWLSHAAAGNQPMAQYELGVMYENGRGVAADRTQAYRWFESAALKGNRRAMHGLATAYAEGWGTEKNLSEAARWYGRAAQLGSVNDQFNLGVLFERGMGVIQSLPDAYKWYAIAAAQGDKESQSRIAAIAPMLAPDDLTAAQNAAQTFKPDTVSVPANSLPVLAQKR